MQKHRVIEDFKLSTKNNSFLTYKTSCRAKFSPSPIILNLNRKILHSPRKQHAQNLVLAVLLQTLQYLGFQARTISQRQTIIEIRTSGKCSSAASILLSVRNKICCHRGNANIKQKKSHFKKPSDNEKHQTKS